MFIKVKQCKGKQVSVNVKTTENMKLRGKCLDRQTDRQTDGRTGGRMDGWTNRWIDESYFIKE